MPTPDVTPEIVGDVGRKMTLRLAGGLIAFLVIFNVAAVVLLAVRPVNRGNWLVRAKWDLLDRTSPVETLVLGDSSCNQGVVPAVLDAKLHTRSINLCTIGNMLAVNDAWMLDEYISAHGAPKRVVIVHVYDMWSRDADATFMRLLGKIPRGWGFWKRMTPALDLGISDLEDIVSSKFLPLHAETTSLQQWLTSPGAAMRTRFAIDERGFMAVTEAAPKRVAQNLLKHERELPELTTEPTPINHAALVALDELARTHHLDVTIALAPMVDELWAKAAMQRHVDGLRRAIRRMIGAGSPIRVLDGAPATFTAAQMENVDHVVGDAARHYTEWLADKLTR
jgi:hypothetical protein